ncbi:hypothetical protein CC85DRAFT_210309 [Cutaneotrichosporon oleaginosum]|uniref:Uncharacterized protein n=1 Tax=Cutaneotrichosporon oleaginosum TaxID=879819 RepID=A0A0J0XD41_9TREE|nr:uncharacterized protein CC85DRAFT_210309 [Cutaneotrichosporon oleaginosum]KLT38967.1 hypothetical protein CC85DRAFT_210309 [Cutaneotrichosporon oleaginosum]TXT14679.1 hypothetical protein COLE_00872 [Cutaneotrichosporon oleaginosum]
MRLRSTPCIHAIHQARHRSSQLVHGGASATDALLLAVATPPLYLLLLPLAPPTPPTLMRSPTRRRVGSGTPANEAEGCVVKDIGSTGLF